MRFKFLSFCSLLFDNEALTSKSAKFKIEVLQTQRYPIQVSRLRIHTHRQTDRLYYNPWRRGAPWVSITDVYEFCLNHVSKSVKNVRSKTECYNDTKNAKVVRKCPLRASLPFNVFTATPCNGSSFQFISRPLYTTPVSPGNDVSINLALNCRFLNVTVYRRYAFFLTLSNGITAEFQLRSWYLQRFWKVGQLHHIIKYQRPWTRE